MYKQHFSMSVCQQFLGKLRKHFAESWGKSSELSKSYISYSAEINKLSEVKRLKLLQTEENVVDAEIAAFKAEGDQQLNAKRYLFLERLMRIEVLIQQYMRGQNPNDFHAIIKALLFLESMFLTTEVVLPPDFLTEYYKNSESLRELMLTDTVVNRIKEIVGEIDVHNHKWIVCLHELYFQGNGTPGLFPSAESASAQGARVKSPVSFRRTSSARKINEESILYRNSLYTNNKYIAAEHELKELVFLPRDQKEPLVDDDYFRVHMQLVEALSCFSFTEDIVSSEMNQTLNETTKNFIKSFLKLYLQFHACQKNNDSVRLKYKERVNCIFAENRVYKLQNGMNLSLVTNV